MLHGPAVGSIFKGKARIHCEFGCKVSLSTTLDEGFVVGARSFPGNPHDGHTRGAALELVGVPPERKPASPWSTAAIADTRLPPQRC